MIYYCHASGMGSYFPRAMAPCKNKVLHLSKEHMEKIKIKKGSVFILETEVAISDEHKTAIIEQWKQMFPDNPIIISKVGTIKILEIDNHQSE
jgi:short-subunit dehydrogenase involved in D-alanine esterification of teichoic acids